MTPHLYQLLQERARRYPNAIAFGGQQGIGWRTLNSVELLRNVDVLAAELAAKGVSQGDRVVLWLPNQPSRIPTAPRRSGSRDCISQLFIEPMVLRILR